MDLDWTTETVDGVTLVSVRLTNETPTDRRIRLENRLDGPVLPPRRQGVPEAGWNDRGYETVVPAGERVAVGYACPAPPCDPPVDLVADERALDGVDDTEEASAVGVVRRLGTADPPRDAVPTPESADVQPPEQDPDDAVDADGLGRPRVDDAADTTAAPTTVAVADEDSVTDLPEPVSEWLDAVETRVNRAEALTDPSVVAATEALADAGGLAAVDDLPEKVAADAADLRAVAARAEALAERAETTDVSLAPLRRLA